MKTTPLDFVLCGLVLAAIAAADLAVASGLTRLTRATLGPYHVLADGLLVLYLFGVLCAAAVRLILWLRPLEPGTYSMEDPVFTRWKLCTVLYELGRSALAPFTPVFAKPFVFTLFGARMGGNVAIGGVLGDPWMVTVGDGGVVGHFSALVGHVITGGRITLARVFVGKGATVGGHCAVLAGAEVGEGSVVASASVVKMGTKIPPGELWGGVPARKIKQLEASDIRG